MKKWCFGAAVLIMTGIGFCGGYFTGSGKNAPASVVSAVPELVDSDEAAGYTLPQRVEREIKVPASGVWTQDGSGYHYTDAGGNPAVGGWYEIDDASYHFDGNGIMQTGWLNDNGTYYYLDSDGRMWTGWAKADGKWYYLNEDGKMLYNTTTPDGYDVNSLGELYYKR